MNTSNEIVIQKDILIECAGNHEKLIDIIYDHFPLDSDQVERLRAEGYQHATARSLAFTNNAALIVGSIVIVKNAPYDTLCHLGRIMGYTMLQG